MSTRFAEPYWAAQKYMGNVPYGVAKAATDKMTRTHFINSRLCERRLGGCSARRGATQRVVPFASSATTRCAAQIPFAQVAIYEMSSAYPPDSSAAQMPSSLARDLENARGWAKLNANAKKSPDKIARRIRMPHCRDLPSPTCLVALSGVGQQPAAQHHGNP
jgi:hypothetical protein